MAKILVIDDDPEIRSLLSYFLPQDGHEVAVDIDAGEALRRLSNRSSGTNYVPDLILMDVNMPGMDGFSLSSRLGENDTTRTVPILIITTKGQLRDMFAMSSNVVGFLEKPFAIATLRAAIAKALQSKPPTSPTQPMSPSD